MSDQRSILKVQTNTGENLMARRKKDTGLRRRFRSLLSPQRIAVEAKKAGFVQRKGKIKPSAFIWTLVLGFSSGRDRTIAGLRRAYERLMNTTLAPSAFYERFGSSLAAMLKRLVDHVVAKTAQADRQLGGSLASFVDVWLSDASVIRLHENLEKKFPASRTNHTKAAVKLHVVMSVTGCSSRTVAITGGTVDDRKKLRIGPWVKDRLLLADLGYYGFRMFDRIQRNGGFFISRLKSNANPQITRALRAWRGRSIPVAGRKLQEVLPRLTRSVLDVEVEVRFSRRSYRDKTTRARQTFRVVAVRHPETGKYHTYITNVPADRLSANEVTAAYRLRWQVELLFKACKSEFRLDDVPSRKKEVVEALLYSSILTMLLSQQLLRYLRSKLAPTEQRRATLGRAAAALRAFAPHLLEAVAGRVGSAELRGLERLLLREATDPHLHRFCGVPLEHSRNGRAA